MRIARILHHWAEGRDKKCQAPEEELKDIKKSKPKGKGIMQEPKDEFNLEEFDLSPRTSRMSSSPMMMTEEEKEVPRAGTKTKTPLTLPPDRISR